MKSGKVVAVSQKDGWAILEMENGDKVYADSIIEVSDTAMTDDEKVETEGPKEPEPDVEGSE
ncbi:hypothetical protein [Paracerasibacillus soli]|uniref:Uncharacterized protein n=2 Tax=Paracerasibacillus soli TaxID=480284 RepID=A0ABU5CP93_9BACI|nr:hypothetical protein [Virgibacillus soli]MDY0408165.1 hypothetical protein [Virgibacillus soli]